MSQVEPVEKPAHVDDARMRHLTPKAVAAAVSPGVGELRAHLAARPTPAPNRDPRAWASRSRGTEAAVDAVAQADTLLVQTVGFTDPAHGRSGLYGLHYLHWMLPLLSAAALTGDARYARRFADLIDQWYADRERVVGAWPGLDVIWYTLGVAGRSQVLLRALHTFGSDPAVPDATWHRMVATVLGGARWLHEEHDSYRPGNWQLAGAAVLGEIATYLPEFAESGAWQRAARDRLVEHLEWDIHPDGGHSERSPTYHLMCLHHLQTAASHDSALGAHPRLRAMHDWLLSMATPGGVVPPFNDSHLVFAGAPLLRGWQMYRDERYLAAARHWLTPAQFADALAWMPEPVPDLSDLSDLPDRPVGAGGPGRADVDLGGSVWLPDSKFAVLRCGGHQAHVNCGPYVGHELESHSHHTALDFVLWGYGAPLAWEAGGPPTYDHPAYQSWFRATRAHNTLTRAVPEADMGEQHDAAVEVCRLDRHADVLVAAHHGWGEVHRRAVLFLRHEPACWVLRDTHPEPYVWWLHGTSPWIVGGDVHTGDVHTGGFHTGSGPGLLVLPVRRPAATDTTSGSGPTRLPGADGTSIDGTVYGLGLSYDGGTSTHVLVPYADSPPRVEVETTPEGVRISRGEAVDVVGPAELTRSVAGRVVATIRWDSEGTS